MAISARHFRLALWLVLAMVIGLYFLRPAFSSSNKLTVFAAASMKDVLEAATTRFEMVCECKVLLSFAGSGSLAHQIDQGAPADLFISANTEWSDWLAKRAAIPQSQIHVVATNSLVMVAASPTSQGANPLDGLLVSRFAMGEPQSVPAGTYAHQALLALGLWESARKNAVFTENVRVSLQLVARGEVGLAIVYGSDALAAPELKVVHRFDPKLYSAIQYPALVLAPENPLAEEFVEFLRGEEGKHLLKQFGFELAANSQ